MNLISIGDASSYNGPYPMTVSKIPKWGFILNCFSDFPIMNDPYL